MAIRALSKTNGRRYPRHRERYATSVHSKTSSRAVFMISGKVATHFVLHTYRLCIAVFTLTKGMDHIASPSHEVLFKTLEPKNMILVMYFFGVIVQFLFGRLVMMG
jgi:hypothetical protein